MFAFIIKIPFITTLIAFVFINKPVFFMHDVARSIVNSFFIAFSALSAANLPEQEDQPHTQSEDH